MQFVREATRDVGSGLASVSVNPLQASLPLFGVQGESGAMGLGIEGQPVKLEQITRAEPPDKCDVCGRTVDVAQIIGTVEGPDPETGGVATLMFLCSFCCARAIQATTGFRMVRQLKNWYHIRMQYPKVDPKYYRKVRMQDTSIE